MVQNHPRPATQEALATIPPAEKVYYLNFKPEQNAQWQELADLYTKETGVEVTVLTAASGSYETTLKSEMAQDRCSHPVPGQRPRGPGPLGRTTAMT